MSYCEWASVFYQTVWFIQNNTVSLFEVDFKTVLLLCIYNEFLLCLLVWESLSQVEVFTKTQFAFCLLGDREVGGDNLIQMMQ